MKSKMLSKVMNFVLILLTFVFNTQAFWWQPSSTETPAISVKHIPLTYFRTYTYQPLTGGPFTFPFGFGGSSQTPILGGTRYEQYNYPASQHFGGNALIPPQRPLSHQPPMTTTSTTAAPTTTPPTTTTTTTPAPTTTTSTTTTTTTTTSPPPPLSINTGGGTYGPVPQYESSIYPTYNRRVYMNNYNNANYHRPNYPYPDYASITKTASMYSGMPQRPSHVQFVPCMCPVSVGVPSGLPITGGGGGNGIGRVGGGINIVDPSQNLYMPQARSNSADDDEDGVDLPLDDSETQQQQRSEGSEISETFDDRDDDMLNEDSQPPSLLIDNNNIESRFRQPKVADSLASMETQKTEGL